MKWPGFDITKVAFRAKKPGCRVPKGTKMTPKDRRNSGKEFDTFINLILVACEDEEIKSQLLTISSLPGNARASLLSSFIHKMKKQDVPSDFIEAIQLLKSDDIAAQVHKALEECFH
jgi:hypothetical protein